METKEITKEILTQDNRYVINVPLLFTDESLYKLINLFGIQDNEVEGFANQIKKAGKMDFWPENALGNGADVNQIFSTGFMVVAKKQFNINLDPNTLSWHPFTDKIVSKVIDVNWEEKDVKIVMEPFDSQVDPEDRSDIHKKAMNDVFLKWKINKFKK